MRLKTGPIAQAVMHHFEDCRLVAYLCSSKVPTIGWGNTYYPDGRKVKLGDTCTRAQADEWFGLILKDFENGVAEAVAGVHTTPAQFGAMVCLAYNIGLGPKVHLPGKTKPGFRQSSVLRYHRQGNHAEAAEAFLSWTKSGGRVSKGLVRRRNAERCLYLSDFDGVAKYTQGEVTGPLKV